MFSDLHPEFRPWARWIYGVALDNGLQPRVTSTYRSISRQARLYNEYRAGRRELPAAPPGRSLHNFGLAFDMVAINLPGLGHVWQGVGGRWGGERDPVHFGANAVIPP